jgi:hypothetical protein
LIESAGQMTPLTQREPLTYSLAAQIHYQHPRPALIAGIGDATSQGVAGETERSACVT